MANNVYYFKGFRDARAGRPMVWEAGWTNEQGAAYDLGWAAGF